MNPLPLATARRYADHLVAWLAPYCERLEIAGSIRRERPFVNDVDLVCIPKVTEEKDMLGAVTGRRNHCLDFLQRYIADKNPLGSKATVPHFISGGEKEGKQVLIQLPKCQLDLWFADQRTFATRLLCRTGSKEHNIWLCERAASKGLHWNPYEGLSHPVNPVHPVQTESDLYAALGLDFIDPHNRESAWIAKHLEFGL